MNEFLKATKKGDAFTENGAVSNSSTGSIFIDDFAKAGTYMGRDYLNVSVDMAGMWATCPLTTLKSMFYLRIISRKISVKGAKTDTVQKGQGLKDEFLKRMLWVAYNYPKVFEANLWLIPVVGSYRDIWQLLYLDSITQCSLNRQAIYKEIMHDLADETTSDLFLKYMPIPKAKSKITTPRATVINQLAIEFRNFTKLNNKEFRRLKSEGKGHSWQQYISNKRYDQINWAHIPGKALLSLIKGKFLSNQGLADSYLKWVETQPVLKFNGYPYELYQAADKNSISLIQKYTYDKQFEGLLATARADDRGIKGNVWCALDTSTSMDDMTADGKVSAKTVCISLGIFFSSLNEGSFKDHVIMFDSESKKLHLKGTFTDKIAQIKSQITAWGSTNFQSVIDEIVRVRVKNPEISIEEYPTTLLVVSDMKFNPARGRKDGGDLNSETNYEVAMSKLAQVGLPKINIIWWQVTASTADFPSTIDDKGTCIVSGFDGSVITLILGGEQVIEEDGKPREISMESAFQLAINQEIFNLIKL